MVSRVPRGVHGIGGSGRGVSCPRRVGKEGDIVDQPEKGGHSPMHPDKGGIGVWGLGVPYKGISRGLVRQRFSYI